MFPISKVDLSFLEIADYWSREIQPPASKSELLDLLIRAWWRGEIFGYAPPRLEFLKKMFAKRSGKDELSGIVFNLEGQIGEPTETELADGCVDVDIRPRVPVPSGNTDGWDEAECDPAFQTLGSEAVSCVEHYDDEWLAGFGWFNLSHDEFMKWLATNGYSLPTFWGRNRAGAAAGQITGAAGRKKGPERGTLRRYEAADRTLFSEMETMIEKGMSPTAAAQALADERKLAGVGDPKSRAKRLTSLFLSERSKLIRGPR
jgi:hypothetical protein